MAFATNCDRSTRAATTTLACLNSPSWFERTTALISMKADSLLDVPLLLTQRLHETTKLPNLGRFLLDMRAKAGAIERNCAGDRGPAAGPATTGTDTTRGAHLTDRTASAATALAWMLNMTRVATSGNSSSMLLWPVCGVKMILLVNEQATTEWRANLHPLI